MVEGDADADEPIHEVTPAAIASYGMPSSKASANMNHSSKNDPSTKPQQQPKPQQQKPPTTPSDNAEPDPEDPFNFADLTQAFERADKRFSDDLKRVRTGGRFNADAIGQIPVQLDKKSPQTFPLRELATVVPLGGRRWGILAFEEASVKPILSAVQRSDEFNQQPQRSADNPLELVMTVEPERADALVRRARDVCQAWRTKVRDEAHRRAEVHKKWKAERVVSGDDLYRLRTEVQKLQDERMKGILECEKAAVKMITARVG